jgi:GNAT superfamily N-acetyltransferase
MKGIIEKALRTDLPEILSMQKAAFAPIASLLNRAELQPMTQTLPQIEAEYDNWNFLKYTLDERIVGSVRIYVDDSHNCHIGKLVVLPDYQSKGIGKALMHAVHEGCKDCNRFMLYTGKDVPSIVNFYRALGYTQIYTDTLDGVLMVFMERKSD